MLLADARQIEAIAGPIFDGLVGSVRTVAANPIAATPYVMPGQSIPLFRDGPNFADIHQGGLLADCWLVSAFAGVAEKRPDIITSMFTDNGDNTYQVRYHELEDSGFVTHYVTVDEQLPTGYADYSEELWVALAEKAYAITDGGGSYAALSGGVAAEALTWIVGPWSYQGFPRTLSDFETDYAAGYLIWLLSSSVPQDPGIVAGHVYSLESYDTGTQILTLYNPWGVLVTISWSEVFHNFLDITAASIPDLVQG